jgi:hypothetical protein
MMREWSTPPPSENRRYGAERRLSNMEGGAMEAVATMLALALLLMVIDRMRE